MQPSDKTKEEKTCTVSLRGNKQQDEAKLIDAKLMLSRHRTENMFKWRERKKETSKFGVATGEARGGSIWSCLFPFLFNGLLMSLCALTILTSLLYTVSLQGWGPSTVSIFND